ncbi:hypothetical protein HOU08_gp250 [Dickeya phage vB_DsoM_JA29]|uniref:Uncharacterized protein n=1 Tax=Dickeya phage vB_DsoM_JA29 TaxID=2283031 RepID=A0A384ZXM1_9CAUD|nr:hypothetical protein HOU08_gp250 [Dickeya phage vB_DsoM_JA29]AXG66976.1 hypothetical protein JA29_250 [Dickeya phage vB_DsoM_JA29]
MDNLPKKGAVFSLIEVAKISKESNRDVYLGFVPPVRTEKCQYKFLKPSVVEYQHIGLDALLLIPGWAETKWRFLHFSPIGFNACFAAIDSEEISALCEYQPHTFDLLVDSVCSFPLNTDFKQSPPYDPAIHGRLIPQ